MTLEVFDTVLARRSADDLEIAERLEPDNFPLVAGTAHGDTHRSISRLLSSMQDIQIGFGESLAEEGIVAEILAGDESSRTEYVLCLLERCLFFESAERRDVGYIYTLSSFFGYGIVDQLISRLLPYGVDLDPVTLPLARFFAAHRNCYYWLNTLPIFLKLAEERWPTIERTKPLHQQLLLMRSHLTDGEGHGHDDSLVESLDSWLGEGLWQTLAPGEHWSDRATNRISQMSPEQQASWRSLLAHCKSAKSAKPSARWSKKATTLIEQVGRNEIVQESIIWLEQYDKGRSTMLVGSVWESVDESQRVHHENANVLRGMLWILGDYNQDDVARLIGRVAISSYRKARGIGPRATRVGNAAVYALGKMPGMAAIGQLALLAVKVKFGTAQKQIDKALNAAAEREGLPRDEIEEMAVPAYGLTEVGKRSEQMGDFTAELVVTGTTSTELRWIKPDGNPQKTVPEAVKDNHADDLKELKAAAKDIQKMLPAQRDRIDLLHLKQKTWAYPTWRERYLDHPLVGMLARRLIWTFDSVKPVDATWLDGQLVDASGDAVQIDNDATVSLWHPIGHDEADVLAWRRFFEDHEIKQPFKQAHREVYLLTDAERNTNTYSNRYASHIIKQHQYNALCGVRGWKNQLRLCVDADYPPTYVELPEWNLRAEFWVEGVGDDYGVDTNESGVYLYLATDQVRFYELDAAHNSAHAGGGGYTTNALGAGTGNINEPIPLDQIPPLVFSEIMRDVDLFVGVASVANDPNWQDGGPEGRYRDYWHDTSFGDLGATAQTRREILERLVPKLKIAERCSFDEKFLIVRGDKRTYKIHLGSSNILMEPNDQYLCIVPGRGAGPGDKVFLPFEGDQRLAVILSKAMMLAADTKITDRTILSQIGR